ncbi:hypothetical protein CHLRE_17g715176v5 [Chlamydomonas reinhardtii]|uniref:Uncharacterized protein n=1 Tax=Chlamydomonas reinhardtii TaxID=3055 RepID=A0A2K3CPV5_CHLRE|nr:uncharacterized protein CHLRE_17g715176v5 [Chlamydomonas reinhardtii]PNW70322.1 hypothetical protein CHLRE_17g715176v5 [Chlamydomonas reinhardtii]
MEMDDGGAGTHQRAGAAADGGRRGCLSRRGGRGRCRRGAATTAGANARPGPSGANPRGTQPPPAAAEPIDAEDPMSEALDASRAPFVQELADEYIGKHYPLAGRDVNDGPHAGGAV